MEEVVPPQTENGTGYERTRVLQFTIFLENRVGRLSSLVRTLEESVARINGISIEESADAALVRVICAEPMEGRLAVELPMNRRHPMMTLCTALLSAEINIRYVYPLLIRPRGPALAMYVDDPTLAAQIMIRKGFTIISENDLLL
jgi:hypothetical protein